MIDDKIIETITSNNEIPHVVLHENEYTFLITPHTFLRIQRTTSSIGDNSNQVKSTAFGDLNNYSLMDSVRTQIVLNTAYVELITTTVTNKISRDMYDILATLYLNPQIFIKDNYLLVVELNNIVGVLAPYT